MEYKFVLKDKGTINQGWWLCIDNLPDLVDYYQKKDNDRIARVAVLDTMECDEFVTMEQFKDPNPRPVKGHCKSSLGYYIGMVASNNGMSIIGAVQEIQNRKMNSQIDLIQQGYNIYINRNGGWHFDKDDYSDWCRRKELVFPDFKVNQIKVERFPGGEHFYAYVDDMQVRDEDTVKWNTYGEAYEYAKKIVGEA